MRKPKGDVAMVTLTRNTTTAMKGSSLWAGSPDLQGDSNAKSVTYKGKSCKA